MCSVHSMCAFTSCMHEIQCLASNKFQLPGEDAGRDIIPLECGPEQDSSQHLFPNMLYWPGLLHICHNAYDYMMRYLAHYDDMYALQSAMVRIFHDQSYVDVFCNECLTGNFANLKQLFQPTPVKTKLIENRFLVAVDSAKELLQIQLPITQTWSFAKMQNAKHAKSSADDRGQARAQPADSAIMPIEGPQQPGQGSSRKDSSNDLRTVTSAIGNPLFWSYLDMVVQVSCALTTDVQGHQCPTLASTIAF